MIIFHLKTGEFLVLNMLQLVIKLLIIKNKLISLKEEVNLDLVDMFDSNNKHHEISIQILAAEDTWETPSLLLAKSPSGGKIIFSQVIINFN